MFGQRIEEPYTDQQLVMIDHNKLILEGIVETWLQAIELKEMTEDEFREKYKEELYRQRRFRKALRSGKNGVFDDETQMYVIES